MTSYKAGEANTWAPFTRRRKGGFQKVHDLPKMMGYLLAEMRILCSRPDAGNWG
jgi:hypothetical protein